MFPGVKWEFHNPTTKTLMVIAYVSAPQLSRYTFKYVFLLINVQTEQTETKAGLTAT